jgi:hypothetical protein
MVAPSWFHAEQQRDDYDRVDQGASDNWQRVRYECQLAAVEIRLATDPDRPTPEVRIPRIIARLLTLAGGSARLPATPRCSSHGLIRYRTTWSITLPSLPSPD